MKKNKSITIFMKENVIFFQRMLLSELWDKKLREMQINFAFMYFQALFVKFWYVLNLYHEIMLLFYENI